MIQSSLGNCRVAADAEACCHTEQDLTCGAACEETLVSHDEEGNVRPHRKSEDQQRRWFYSHCLTTKLHCADEALASRVLISDLYAQVRAHSVPFENWVQWIRLQLTPDGVAETPVAEELRRGVAEAPEAPVVQAGARK